MAGPLGFGPLVPLPATVPGATSAQLFLRLRPTACTGPARVPWGTIHISVDFGPGAFPGVHRAVTLPGGLVTDPSDLELRDGTSGPTLFSTRLPVGDDGSAPGMTAPPAGGGGPAPTTPPGPGPSGDPARFLDAACRALAG